MKETFDPRLRWNVIEVDHNEQEPGGEFGKRRIKNAEPMRREEAERFRAHCEEVQKWNKRALKCKSHRTYILEAVRDV